MSKMNRFMVIGMIAMIVFAGCASVSTGKAKYVLVYDPSIMSNSVAFASWMSYTGVIREDMEKYDADNPQGNYVIPFDIELRARERLLETYINLRNNAQLQGRGNSPDQYIEDLIMIKDAGYFNEYTFFSFNPGTWENNLELNNESYLEWKDATIPDHKPLTLGEVERDN
jgi:hypothetical protein